MVASVYSELVQFEEVGGDIVDRIRKMGVYDVFEDIIKYYEEDHHMFNKALFFILHAYSINSKYHVLGQSWNDIKNRIAEHVGIDPQAPFVKRRKKDKELEAAIEQNIDEFENVLLYTDLVALMSPEVIKTIQKYLDYQGNSNFKHLCMLKEQYVQMVAGALDPIRKSTGEIDYDQKHRNRTYATMVLKEIAEWEQKVADNSSHLKDAIGEVKRKQPQTLRLEDNL